MDLSDIVTSLGGAVGDLFTSKGNAAQAADYQGAASLATQNAQLAAASTKIQETQTARTVTQSLGTTQADIAGAGFTMSGSALDIMRASAQQGSLAKSLVNIQGAINENSYAAQAGAYSGEAKAAKEASDAAKVNAIASVGGALIGGAGQLASAGSTIAKGYNYVTSLFSGGGAAGVAQSTAPDVLPSLVGQSLAPDVLPSLAASATDSSISAGASLASTDIGIDTSGIALGTSADAVTTGIGDAIASGFGDIAATVGGFVTDAAATAAAVGADVVAGVSAAGEALSAIGDAIAVALCVICTAFYKRGMVERSVWLGAQRYGQALDPMTFAGYHYWAMPIANKITKDEWFAKLMAPIFIPPVNEMAIIMGRKDIKRTIYGFVSHKILFGLSWTIGRVMKGKKYVTARA